MGKKSVFCVSLLIFLSACGAPTPAATQQIVTVYATPAAQPWLTDLYDCAAQTSAVLNLSPISPEITIRLGEPEELSTPAYQIGTEEILVIVNRQSQLDGLTIEQARALFAGQGDASAQVWVYASDADAQRAFDQLVMNGRRVASSARLAVGPGQMVEALNADANAVGILPRRWMAEGLREILALSDIPVLAITQSEPTGVIRGLIACLQKDD